MAVLSRGPAVAVVRAVVREGGPVAVPAVEAEALPEVAVAGSTIPAGCWAVVAGFLRAQAAALRLRAEVVVGRDRTPRRFPRRGRETPTPWTVAPEPASAGGDTAVLFLARAAIAAPGVVAVVVAAVAAVAVEVGAAAAARGTPARGRAVHRAAAGGRVAEAVVVVA
jgi:hypothetical protein